MIISVLLFADFILKLYADIPHVANIPYCRYKLYQVNDLPKDIPEFI
ncbi:hypothetical protein [Methanoplanus limicola]|nr:hypothetical protein [Methanoplanus limicola]